ncbi:hypothetical protein KBZ10_20305 [Streptomyces sp. F63]|nr:hypothetical protein [Streptomyces sp. F63]MBQ0986813.1 hypothetical protein [Streptomyces sp. F63]
MGLLTVATATRPATESWSTFAKEGGRIGSGALGSGEGGVGRCARG